MATRKRRRDTSPVNRICFHCVYLMQPEPLDSYRDILPTRVIFPLCAHHAQSPGVVREVHPAETSPNFRARRRPAERPPVESKTCRLTERRSGLSPLGPTEHLCFPETLLNAMDYRDAFDRTVLLAITAIARVLHYKQQ